jgi:hypothetical protein
MPHISNPKKIAMLHEKAGIKKVQARKYPK